MSAIQELPTNTRSLTLPAGAPLHKVRECIQHRTGRLGELTRYGLVAQLPQTSYHSLQTPYSFFGLGRTNNYIENLFVGSTKHSAEHFINMEGVIPNSRVVIMPPAADENSWKRELYLRPGEWIPWVTLTIVIATLILGIVVFVLHLNEKVPSFE